MPDFDLDAVLSSERPEVDWVCPGCGRLFELRSWYSPVDLLEPERHGDLDVIGFFDCDTCRGFNVTAKLRFESSTCPGFAVLSRCPQCRSRDTDTLGVEVEPSRVVFHEVCDRCGEQWSADFVVEAADA